jgi:hypothetical protein
MNRSILIVICDFLLVSLLAFSTVDINKATDITKERTVSTTIATNQAVEPSKDLTAVMRMALDEERRNRDQLMTELNRSRESATQREKRAQEIEKQMQEREAEAQRLAQQQTNLQQQVSIAQANLAAVSQQLQTSAGEAQRLGQQLATKDAEAQRLSQQLTAKDAEALRLSQQAQTSSAEALMSREKLAAMEAEVKKNAEQAQALQQKLQQQEQQMAALAKSNQLALNEKQQLATQLQVAEVEKKNATEQVVRAQEQIQTERQEKAKLAEGVKALASKSGELEKEIRENRPLAPNTIFSEFASNRVAASITAMRSGLLADSNRRRDTESVFVSDGTNIFALCHIDDTPFTLFNPGIDWERITGTVGRGLTQLPISSVSFHLVDPRIVIIPVPAATAKQIGGKVYKVSADPYKFQDAVVVGAREGYYGQCNFQVDLTTPDYVKLDRSVLRGLFGKFNPSRGDLVFSKTGELLGIMANSNYCMMLRTFDSAATIRFGQDTRAQHTGTTLSLLFATLQGMPQKLQ